MDKVTKAISEAKKLIETFLQKNKNESGVKDQLKKETDSPIEQTKSMNLQDKVQNKVNDTLKNLPPAQKVAETVINKFTPPPISENPKIMGRPMNFPYTFSAKIVQFPWMYYIRNNWIYRYYFIAVLCSLPFFKKFSNMANTPDNKKKWAEIRRKEAEEHHH